MIKSSLPVSDGFLGHYRNKGTRIRGYNQRFRPVNLMLKAKTIN